MCVGLLKCTMGDMKVFTRVIDLPPPQSSGLAALRSSRFRIHCRYPFYPITLHARSGRFAKLFLMGAGGSSSQISPASAMWCSCSARASVSMLLRTRGPARNAVFASCALQSIELKGCPAGADEDTRGDREYSGMCMPVTMPWCH